MAVSVILNKKMKKENKKWLLDLAKRAVESELAGKKLEVGKIPAEFLEKKACFVTLTKNGELRGCIGHLVPVQELYLDVIDNARAAAFEDYRFEPVGRSEWLEIEVEVSILEIPKKYVYTSPEELIKYLGENKPGVIIKKGFNQATYLPQVWDELGDPEEFMSSLCRKAGLEAGEWRKMREIEVYGVEKLVYNKIN